MARQIVLEIEANAGTATGALQEIQTKIEQLKRGFTEGEEAADSAFNQIGRSSENAISSIRGLERATQQVFSELVENTGQGVRAIDSMEASFNDLQRRAQISADELRDFNRVQGRVTTQGQTMRSSVGASANNLGFEMVQATQDAKFGMAGLANQIPLMSEQFTQLQAKTGSTTGALKSLGASLIGPVGIVGAITLLLTYQEEVTSFFTDAGAAAEKSAEQIDKLKEATSNFIEVQSGLSFEAVEIGLERARALMESAGRQIGETESRIERLEGFESVLEGVLAAPTRVPLDELASAQKLIEETAITEQQLLRAREVGGEQFIKTTEEGRQAATELRQVLDDQISNQQESLEGLKAQRQNLEGQVDEAEALKQIWEGLPSDIRNAAQETTRIEVPDLGTVSLPDSPTARVEGPEIISPEELFAGDIGAQLETIGDLQQANLISPLQAAQQEVQAIQQEIRAAIQGGWEPQSDKVQGLQTRLQAAQQDLKQMTNLTQRLGAVTQQILVRGFLRLGDAIGQGVTQAIFEAESAAEALENAFRSVVQSIIQQLISLATQLLVIRALSNFIPGLGQASSFSGGIVSIGGTPAGDAFGIPAGAIAADSTTTFSGREPPSVRSFGSSSSTGSTSFSIGKAGTESARVAGGMLDISVPLGLLDEGVGQGQEMRRRTGKGGANLEGGSLSV